MSASQFINVDRLLSLANHIGPIGFTGTVPVPVELAASISDVLHAVRQLEHENWRQADKFRKEIKELKKQLKALKKQEEAS